MIGSCGARQVVDVGGGTGFCTQGIVEHIPQRNVTLIDQSPDQLNKARGKQDLQGIKILEVRCMASCGIMFQSTCLRLSVPTFVLPSPSCAV